MTELSAWFAESSVTWVSGNLSKLSMTIMFEIWFSSLLRTKKSLLLPFMHRKLLICSRFEGSQTNFSKNPLEGSMENAWAIL